MWHDPLGTDADADRPWHRLVKDQLQPARDLAGKRVLEIGCGRGGFAAWLAARPVRPRAIVAADFAATAVLKGRRFATLTRVDAIAWVVADIYGIPHATATFDTVISCETIEHVLDPRRALRELARVLKPGGRLFLTTPNYLGPMGLYRAYLRLLGRSYTETGQPINKLVLLPLTRRWVRAAGLSVEAVDGIGHYLPCPGRPPIELPRLNGCRPLTRWMGLHSLIVATKPGAGRSVSS